MAGVFTGIVLVIKKIWRKFSRPLQKMKVLYTCVPCLWCARPCMRVRCCPDPTRTSPPGLADKGPPGPVPSTGKETDRLCLAISVRIDEVRECAAGRTKYDEVILLVSVTEFSDSREAGHVH